MTSRATTTTTRATTTTEAEAEATAAGTTKPGHSPREGRPESGAAAAYVGELFAAHGRMVLGLCRLLLRDPVEAEDAAQQVFVSAQRALVGGAVVREPAAWLATIARNECRARVRARMREPLALPQLPADILDPLAAAIYAADLDALWAALSELPRRQRNAFLLRELGGLSYGELGVALGVTRPAVESLLFRARQQLRDMLGTMNAVLVPVALRDQLTRFVPFGAPGGGAPFAAKAAAVTVGVGLGAVGAVELPKQHAHHARARPPAAVQSESRDVSFAPQLVIAHTTTELQHTSNGQGRSGHEPREAEHETEHRSLQAERRHEQEHQGQADAPEQDNQAPPSGDNGGNQGDGSSGDGHDGSTGDGGGSGSHDGGDLANGGD